MDVIDALDFACVSGEFVWCSATVSNYAASTVVALVGRNEGGKTLSRSAVNAVLDRVANFFDAAHYFSQMSLS